MKSPSRLHPRAHVTTGYAAADRGPGLAYAVVRNGERRTLLRVPFEVKPLPALLGRDVGYAALRAVAHALRKRGIRDVTFAVDDDHLPLDLAERRALPTALSLPYVALRCVLNQFHDAPVTRAGDDARDLTARARAEVSLLVAA